MKVNTTNVEKVNSIVSEDGTFGVYCLVNKSEEEIKQAEEKVKEYEKSAAGVMYSLMQKSGAVSDRIQYKQPEEDGKLTEENYKFNQYLNFLDAIVEDGCENFYWRMFTPKTEEDVKNMMIFLSIKGITTFSNPLSEDRQIPYSLYARELKAGSNYIMGESEDWWIFIEIDKVAERVKAMADHLVKMCKDFRK